MSFIKKNAALGLGLVMICAVDLARAAGPDIIVHDLDGVHRWGRFGNITAYSVGTVSCNIGDTDCAWVASTNQHPVIAQNMYRLKDGRFEQIGQSWLKHGFFATNESACSTCQTFNDGSALGPGCSDPYSPALNGARNRLGPRSLVNPTTGAFPYPFSPPSSNTTIGRRLQVHDANLVPAANANAVYYVEGQYVTPDDALLNNDDNNVSYRRVIVKEEPPGSSFFTVTVAASTVVATPAIEAWKTADSGVGLMTTDITGDGRFFVAARARNLENGFWAYEFAVANLNSDRAAGTFRVNLHPWTVLRNIGFHDVDYHSGEPYDGSDWLATRDATGLIWKTVDHSVNANANALRWGTLYNFRFEANVPPSLGAILSLGMFKPGAPAEILVPPPDSGNRGPSTAAPDCNGNSTADFLEIAANPDLDCDLNGNLDSCDLDCDGNLTPDACDIAADPLRDCNENDVPDSCEIAHGAADCDKNGTPDSCQLADATAFDCNQNGTLDHCDIAADAETDCDGDSTPDSCQIAATPELDCNLNGWIDSCGETDCNGNLIPDDCEGPICAGILTGDADCSGIVDEGDIPELVTRILAGNPSCIADLNLDGMVDGRDVAAFIETVLGD